MDTPIALSYDAKLVRSAVLSYWWRIVGPGYVVVLLFLGGMFAALVVRNNHTWYVGFLGGVLVFAVVIPSAIFISHYKRSMARLKRMEPPQAQLTLSSERLSLESSVGSSSISWSAVTEIWRYPSYWLLFFSRAQFVTLPLASVPEAAQAFMLERVKCAGGKVG